MAAKPKSTTIDEYLASVSADQRAALEKLRKMIKTAAPKAEEYINYGIPAFRLNGKMLVGFGAGKNHCSFYPSSGKTVAAHQAELKDYDTSKGTICFTPDEPLPATLVRKLVKARIAENEMKQSPKRAAPVVRPKQNNRGHSRKTSTQQESGSSQTDPAVITFLRDLDHPLKQEIETVRQIILSVSPEIHEGIKWNAPSFRTKEYFATVNLRARDRVQLVFHKGAKVKDNSTKGMQIADPAGLIEWLAKDRCLVTLGTGKDIPAHQTAFAAIVREWIGQM